MDKTTNIETANLRTRNSRKIREAALTLPIFGIALFLTPIPNLFTSSQENNNITEALLYIFGAWAILILFTFILSRLLRKEIRDD